MQFSTVALIAAAAAVVSADTVVVTATNESTTVVSVIDSSCEALGTACPLHQTESAPAVPTSISNATVSTSNSTQNVSTYEAGAVKPLAAGAVALFAGALLAL